MLPASPDLLLLDVTECFCPGDRFSLFLEGVPLGPTAGAFRYDPDCKLRLSEAQECWEDDRYCHGRWLLPGGDRERLVELLVVENPYTGGAGAIRVQSACRDEAGNPFPCCELDDTCLHLVNWT